MTFFKIFPNCLKRPKTLFDSRPTVAWPPITVTWPLSDYFQIFSKLLETSINLIWQSADGRVTSDHCRVTVQRLFQNVIELLETSKKRCLTVGRRSRDIRPLSRDRSATFSKMLPNCSKRSKTLFDSRPTVAWPPTTVAWPFSDYFQIFSKLLETSIKRYLTVGRRSRDLRPLSRDRSATFSKMLSNCLKRRKNVVWQSADGRVTSDHCRVTVQRRFPKCYRIARNVQKRCSTVGQRSRDLQPQSRDRSATFFKNFLDCLKRRKNVVWKSVHGRVIVRLLCFRVFFVRFQHTLPRVGISRL